MTLPETLVNQIKNKKLIPFVGAGCSLAIKNEQKASIFPGWEKLLLNAAAELKNERENTAGGLVELLVESDRLLDAAKEARKGFKGKWIDFMRSQFDLSFEDIDDAEFILARTLLQFDSQLVVTTNYDTVLEYATRDTVTWGIAQPAEFIGFGRSVFKTDKKVIWHIHGHINKADELILTPESYEHLYDCDNTRNAYYHATDFFNLLYTTNSFLFVGFGLTDHWLTKEMRDIIEECSEQYGSHYVLLKEGDTEGEKIAKSLGIEVIYYAEHGTSLIEKLNELLDYQKVDSKSEIEIDPPQKQPICSQFYHLTDRDIEGMADSVTNTSQSIPASENFTAKEHISTPSASDKNLGFKLSHLWEEAFTPMEGSALMNADLFLKEIVKLELDYSVTALQNEFMQGCKQARSDNDLIKHPFHGSSNVLISAPTSSGKTTLAEIFLFMNLFSAKRKCAVYLSPTRSLAQAKYREFCETYGELTNQVNGRKLKEQIIISTGEDTEKDHLLFKGQFAIACLVYEKANILFSQSDKLISNIGCVVVDELHMIQQTQRGVGVEMLVAKLQRERKDGRHGDQLKIIGISTEGEPPQSLIDFFTTAINRKDVLPIVINSNKRPVEVEHHLILPSVNESSRYNDVSIGIFNESNERVLPIETRTHLMTKITNSYAGKELTLDYDEFQNRFNGLLDDILARKINSQLLVFVDSKNNALSFARKVLIQLKALNVDEWGAITEQEIDALLLETEQDDITIDIKKLAAYGIFLHHADIDRHVRTFIEETFCKKERPSCAPRIIFATQTLSYGVNLTVDDVIILHTTSYMTDRSGNASGHDELSLCDFHNMAGRAGRLRQGNNGANVYIFSSRDKGAFLVDYFYREPPKLRSKLFVNEDSANYLEELRLQNKDIYRNLDFNDFTYPFASSVLDGLSHLTSKQVSHASNMVPLRELIKFFRNTFFSHEIKNDDIQVLHTFEACVHSVLWRCSQEEYRLVNLRNEQYSITELGAAVISTGTDLKSISPMIQYTRLLHLTWQKHYIEYDIPVELFLLVVIAQKEIFSIKVNETPEGRNTQNSWNKEMIDANRKKVKENLISILGEHFSVFERSKSALTAFIDDLVLTLDQNLVALQAAKITTGYLQGITDSILRLFSGVLVWIKMENMSSVRHYIQEYKGPNENARNMDGKLTGFQSFINQISWKLRFLGTLIKKWPNESVDRPRLAKDLDKELEQEIALWNLANQVRIGCLPIGVDLYYPTGSNLQRVNIRSLLDKGITPLGLLSSDIGSALGDCEINDDKGKPLLRDLQHKAIDSFGNLLRSMVIGLDEDYDNRRNMKLHRLWTRFQDFFKESMRQFPQNSLNYRTTDFSKRLLSMFDFPTLAHEMKDDKSFNCDAEFIGIKYEDPGMVWRSFDDKGQPYGHKVKILCLQFNTSWDVFYNNQGAVSFENILEQEKSTQHLLLIAAPWVPLLDGMPAKVAKLLKNRQEQGFTTTFISLGAFATMITTIVRRWVEPTTYLDRFQRPHSQLLRLVLTRSILKISDRDFINAQNTLPNAIRESVIELFEVGNDYEEVKKDMNNTSISYQVGWEKRLSNSNSI